MRRTLSSVVIGDNRRRHTARIESDPCPSRGPQSRAVVFALLETLGQVPDMTLCGSVPFQKLTITHDSEKWVATAEAVTDE